MNGLRATAVVKVLDDGIYVTVVWSGAELDRPSTGGFRLMSGQIKLAQRLQRAINDQRVYEDAKVAQDVNGSTYVDAKCIVMGRYMDSDLKRLGY